jgi:hypothetical protein
MAYTTIDDPEAHFQVKIYTGNGTDDTAITFDGITDMSPNLVWTKARTLPSGNEGHSLIDSVRGVTKILISNGANSEGTDSTRIKSFDSDGYTMGTQDTTNLNTATYVSWNWKAGTSFTNDASATGIGSIDSTGSINTDAGFSIVSFTGNSTSGATVGHGISKPDMVIVKQRAGTGEWCVYHKSLGATKVMLLNSTAAPYTDTTYWNDTAPTSTTFTLGSSVNSNPSTTVIAYLFAEKQGFSKCGSYTGNGNADGPFIYTGFKPAYILQKVYSTTSSWHIHDNKRDTYNPAAKPLYADQVIAEGTDTLCDFLSNGFKIRTTVASRNADGATFIYACFAEAPFVNSNGVPCNAR